MKSSHLSRWELESNFAILLKFYIPWLLYSRQLLLALLFLIMPFPIPWDFAVLVLPAVGSASLEGRLLHGSDGSFCLSYVVLGGVEWGESSASRSVELSAGQESTTWNARKLSELRWKEIYKILMNSTTTSPKKLITEGI